MIERGSDTLSPKEKQPATKTRKRAKRRTDAKA